MAPVSNTCVSGRRSNISRSSADTSPAGHCHTKGFQYALQSRAGTDAIVATVGVASRARLALDTVTGAVEAHCGIASNLGKTRRLGGSERPAPPGLAELSPDVWRGDRPSHERGMVVLGSPVGVHRLLEKQQLLQQLPQLPDLQCSWLLLALCAFPRASHALRTVPPTAIASYAAGHDDAIWHTLLDCLGGEAGAPPGCAPRAGDRFPAGSVR